MLPSPRRQIKQLKKTSNTSHDNRQILISASPITTHRSEICRTFLRGNPRAFIEKDRNYENVETGDSFFLITMQMDVSKAKTNAEYFIFRKT